MITGHSEFEYAKSALQLGIRDYILKPFDQEELSQAIQKTVKNLEERRQQRHRDTLRDQAVIEELANALISDSFMTMSRDIEAMIMESAKGNPIWGYRIAAVEEDFFDQQWVSGGQRHLWKKTVINVLEELFLDKYLHISFCGRSGNVVTIFLFTDERMAAEYEGAEFERLCRVVRSKLGFSVTCALNGPVREYKSIPSAYDQAARLLLRKLSLGHGGLLTEKEEETKTAIRHYPRIPVEKLVTSMKNGNLEETRSFLESIFDEIRDRNMNMEITGVVFMELISICLSYLTERGFDIIRILGKDFTPYSQLRLILSVDGAREQIMEIYEKAIGAYTENQFTKSNKIAVRAKEFIEKNYQDRNLSVEGVARNLYINTSYLRTIFKKEYGISVSRCIISRRMEKARELIISERLKLTTVSQMVGFSDAAYFSKCFKKYYGISPSSFENIQAAPLEK